MEKHVQIALNNAVEALAFIDPWARVVAIIDVKRQKMVMDELNEKYRFYGEDTIQQLPDDLQCIVELRLVVPNNGDDDFPDHYVDFPEFSTSRPRKYNEEYYRYRVGLTLEDRSISACQWPHGRQTPYTVEYIAEAKTQTQRKERFDRLVELGAPSTICFHEELMLRSWEYMLPIVEA